MEFHNSFEQTYNEAFIIPFNNFGKEVERAISESEKKTWTDLEKKISDLRQKAQSGNLSCKTNLLAVEKEFFSYQLEIVEKYNLGKTISRDIVDFKPRDGFGNLPIVAANMDGVTGKRMAETMALMGGSAALPQYMSEDDTAAIIQYMKKLHPYYRTPLTLSEESKIYNFENIISKRDLPAVIILNKKDELVGLLHKKDAENVNKDTSVKKLMMTEDIVTATPPISVAEALEIMKKNKVKFLPILNNERKVLGVLTEKSAALSSRYEPHLNHENQGFAVLATIGALNRNPVEKAKKLIDLGVKGIVLDTAHFDQGVEGYSNLQKIADLVANFQKNTGHKIMIIAGNVVTPEATRRIIGAGADIVKVGIGPGAMCSTRYETGVGRPQLSAVMKCVKEAELYGKFVWADGGIKTPRDVALALASGASQVMVGSWFAGTLESPGDLKYDPKNHKYKENYGMASRSASEKRSERHLVREILGHRSEGSNKSLVYLEHERESVADIIHYIIDGVTSSMTYVGAQNLQEFFENATIGIQSQHGYEEGKPVEIMKMRRI